MRACPAKSSMVGRSSFRMDICRIRHRWATTQHIEHKDGLYPICHNIYSCGVSVLRRPLPWRRRRILRLSAQLIRLIRPSGLVRYRMVADVITRELRSKQTADSQDSYVIRNLGISGGRLIRLKEIFRHVWWSLIVSSITDYLWWTSEST